MKFTDKVCGGVSRVWVRMKVNMPPHRYTYERRRTMLGTVSILGNPVSLLWVLIALVVSLGAYWLYKAISQLW